MLFQRRRKHCLFICWKNTHKISFFYVLWSSANCKVQLVFFTFFKNVFVRESSLRIKHVSIFPHSIFSHLNRKKFTCPIKHYSQQEPIFFIFMECSEFSKYLDCVRSFDGLKKRGIFKSGSIFSRSWSCNLFLKSFFIFNNCKF